MLASRPSVLLFVVTAVREDAIVNATWCRCEHGQSLLSASEVIVDDTVDSILDSPVTKQHGTRWVPKSFDGHTYADVGGIHKLQCRTNGDIEPDDTRRTKESNRYVKLRVAADTVSAQSTPEIRRYREGTVRHLSIDDVGEGFHHKHKTSFRLLAPPLNVLVVRGRVLKATVYCHPVDFFNRR